MKEPIESNPDSNETTVSGLLERGVMARAFIEECIEKFERRAKENNRTTEPWEIYTDHFLRKRLGEEFKELFDEADSGPKAIMSECLDIANFAWFIYEKEKARLETGP